MSKLVVLGFGSAALLAALAWAQEAVPTPDADVAAVRETLKSYAAAFNKNDAQAVAALWAQQGVYVDHESGDRTTGRAAILADFQTLFKNHAGARIVAEIANVRTLKPDVATADGRVTVILPRSEPAATSFSAILTRQGDKWLLENVQEMPIPSPRSAHEALRELAWMVGRWTDATESGRVDTTVRWGTGESFLVRSFVAMTPDGDTQQGTQVIGWDPRAQQIRSWSFFSDGSFGEGVWTKSGDEWLVKSQQTLDDGRLASGTQVIRRLNDNTLTVATIGRDIEGEPAPAVDPVKVVRAAASAAAPAAPPAVVPSSTRSTSQ